MNRRLIWILLAGILVGLALSGLYKHFVTDRIMDGGDGMENPDAAFLLDGDHTYVDNDALWPVLEGAWESEDGRWQADIGEESGIVLSADGETVLASPLDFTYLRPGKVVWTELEVRLRCHRHRQVLPRVRQPQARRRGRRLDVCLRRGEQGQVLL